MIARVLFIVALLTALVAVPVAIAVGRDTGAGTPAGTVRGFLVDALDGDGFGACQYLAPNGVREARAMAAPNTACEAVLPWIRFRLGPEVVQTEAQVKALHYAVRESGPRAIVTVGNGQDSRTLVLLRATQAELNAYDAPPTPWRIDSGVTGLVPRVSSGV